MSLYGNLFRYRGREKRTPLEDYLTEALADLLNRMPVSEMLALTSSLFLGQEELWHRLEALSAEGAEFQWVTQRSITYEGKGPFFLDLLLEVDDQPWLIVESKVGQNPLQWHSVSDASDTAESDYGNSEGDDDADGDAPEDASQKMRNQLQTYGQWLALQRLGDEFRGAIAFLTHRTPVPSDYSDSLAGYGVSCRHVCYWRQVHRLLLSYRENVPVSEAVAWRCLALELAEFLKECGMSSETINRQDLLAAELYLGSCNRFKSTFERFYSDFKDILSGYSPHSAGAIKYNSDAGVIWRWVCIKPSDSCSEKDWWLGWGFRFPNVSQWWGDASPALPDQPHAFVILSREKSSLPVIDRSLFKLPEGTSITAEYNEHIIARALHEFPADEEAMVQAVSTWMRDHLKVLIVVAEKMSKVKE